MPNPSTDPPTSPQTTLPAASLGLTQTTAIGVGAIVGGGIFVLAGGMVAQAGPSALIALLLNGLLALITAMSFAEMATAFPENGGEYAFARRALSVRSAFAVGWVVYFAYAVAAALYALGFGSYLLLAADSVLGTSMSLSGTLLTTAALGTALLVALALLRFGPVGGVAANIGKVAVFGFLIAAGLAALLGSPRQAVSPLTPFFQGGTTGILAAMGLSFIILQGFGNIAAVAGNVRDPVRNLPRAMFFSLAIALAIYGPLLFLLVTVGVPPGEDPTTLAAHDPEGYFALAVQNWLGDFGWWLVIIAALLAMVSALQANLIAASGVGRAMALDRTLPRQIATLHPKWNTPAPALIVALALAGGVILVLPDTSTAGAAASLIFLFCFALVHAMAWLVRRRLPPDANTFRTPLFPLVPALGVAGCAGVALHQALLVPTAGWMTLVWLGFGLFFYFGFLSARAEALDHAAAAHDPALMRSRGDSRTILVPIASPDSAAALTGLASTLVPSDAGRVIALQVIVAPRDASPDSLQKALDKAHPALDRAIQQIHRDGHEAEFIVRMGETPWPVIRRTAERQHVHSVLLGLPRDPDRLQSAPLNALLADLHCDVALLCAPEDFQLESVQRVLIPIGGSTAHDVLRARVLGALRRRGTVHFTFLRILHPDVPAERDRIALERLERLLQDEVRGEGHCVITRHHDPTAAILDSAADHDLVLLGATRSDRGGRVLSPLLLRLATRAPCATLILSRPQA